MVVFGRPVRFWKTPETLDDFKIMQDHCFDKASGRLAQGCRRFLKGAILPVVLALTCASSMKAGSESSSQGKVYLILFGGQSNALGWGYQKYLEDHHDPLAREQQDIDLFYSIAGDGFLPEGKLIKLGSGTSNVGPKPGGYYPDLPVPTSRFGPELSLARTFKDRLADPNARVAIVKFAHGGTSLYDPLDWKPDGTAASDGDGKLYQIFQATVRDAVAALKNAYPDREVVIVGMGWVQGESDALEGKGAEYEGHLTSFVRDLRATYGDQLAIAYSQVSPNQYGQSKDPQATTQWTMVAAAQKAVAEKEPRVKMTSTEGPDYPVSRDSSEGVLHFSTPGLLQIGRDLGNALAQLSGLAVVDAEIAATDYTLQRDPTVAEDQGAVIRLGASKIPGAVERFVEGARVFSDRDFLLNSPPSSLSGRPFVRASIDGMSFTVVSAGRLVALTPFSKAGGSSQVSTLEENGFERLFDEGTFPLFGDKSYDEVRVYQKEVQPGENYTFPKWVVVIGATLESSGTPATAGGVSSQGNPANDEGSPQGGQLAIRLEPGKSKGTVGRFIEGARVFSDRAFLLNEPSALMRDKPFLQTSISGVAFTVVTGGRLLVLTPQSNSLGCSQSGILEEKGFEQVLDEPLFTLFGTNPHDLVRIYQKEVRPGESYEFPKWVVVVGAVLEASLPRSSWKDNRGELLYNGIRLPEIWPPRDIPSGHANHRNREPDPVPYLDFPPEVVLIDKGRQLFVDDFLIASSTLRRQFYQPVKRQDNPVLKPETNLEKGLENNLAAAVPKSGGIWWDPQERRFKMWYETGWFGGIGLVTSADGLHWERPSLFPAEERRAPNDVTPGGVKPDSWTVIRDEDTPDASARYKLFVREPGGSHAIGAKCFVSPDGITWTGPSISGGMGDRSTAFYNPFRKKWVFGIRSFFSGRARHYWEGADFLKDNVWKWDETDFWKGEGWAEGEPVVWAAADRLDQPDPEIGMTSQLYNLDAVAYESIMLGFFQIWRGPDNDQTFGKPKITELNFAYSRDGFHWSRPDRRASIPAERVAGAWDRGYLQSIGSICVVMKNELWFYYGGFAGDETRPKDGMYANAATGVAVLRRDGFASMEADQSGGELTTRPVQFSGKRLFVNARVPNGKLRVEVRDSEGKPIAPFTLANSIPFSGDSTLAELKWQGVEDLSALAGRPVCLHFELENGELYSFWVSKDQSGRSDGYLAGGGPGYSSLIDTVGRAALE